ncbi:mobile sperm domain-containing protein [Candidatus Woesearchaeota archaeon]|nr:mobile sperm domain-containing protein [Candidatus Woesearchaeota archaeon]
MQRSFFIYYFLFLLFVAATGAISASQNVTGAGFGVSPSGLEFVVEKGAQASRHLIIYNTGKESAGFRAQSSDPVVIKVSPETGFVEAEGSAAVEVTATGSKIGQTSGEVIISFGSHGSHNEVSLELGTAVPVKLTAFKKAEAAANAFIGMLLSASIVFAGLAAYYFAKRKSSRFAADFQSAHDLYYSQK